MPHPVVWNGKTVGEYNSRKRSWPNRGTAPTLSWMDCGTTTIIIVIVVVVVER
jgi:hypothetical protein